MFVSLNCICISAYSKSNVFNYKSPDGVLLFIMKKSPDGAGRCCDDIVDDISVHVHLHVNTVIDYECAPVLGSETGI